MTDIQAAEPGGSMVEANAFLHQKNARPSIPSVESSSAPDRFSKGSKLTLHTE